jgi:hemerythrin-like domain-containing protein
MDVLEIIKKEHREAGAMLDEAKELDLDDERLGDLVKKIEAALTTHLAIEERLFYARLRERAEEEEQEVDVFEAYTEHEVARQLIDLLKSRRRRDARFKAEVQVLGESVKHHVQEEESTIFAIARKLIDSAERDEIGAKWQKAKQAAASRGAAPSKGSKKRPAAKRPAAKRSASPARKKTRRKA